MMKANYLIALVCISIAACGNIQEPTTSRADRVEKLKKDLDKTFGTGRIYEARIEEDGLHLKTEKGNIVIPLKEDLEKLEGPSMDVKKLPMDDVKELIKEPVEQGPSMDAKKLPIDRILQNMQWGNIAFNSPTSMNLDETVRLHLLLGIKQTIEELQRDIKIEMDKAHLSDGIEGARIKVAPLMQAHLEGSNFDIKPITPEEQPISSEVTTEWLWEAKPKSDGIHRLYLALNAKLLDQNTASYRVIRTFSKQVKVEVTKPQQIMRFIKDNWQWLWAAIVVPVCVCLSKPIKRLLKSALRRFGGPPPAASPHRSGLPCLPKASARRRHSRIL